MYDMRSLLSVRLDDALREALRRRAAVSGTTVSAEVVRALRASLGSSAGGMAADRGSRRLLGALPDAEAPTLEEFRAARVALSSTLRPRVLRPPTSRSTPRRKAR